jgi:hypothetical protein
MISVDGVEHRALRDTHGWAYDNKVGDHSHARWIGDSYSRHGEITPLRPLVVIDPEDLAQVDGLVRGYIAAREESFKKTESSGPVFWMQAALREYANPTLPKPDEPQGLGAVVEDADGDRWVRSRDQHKGLIGVIWENSRTLAHRSYAGIDAVRVLSEGVTP